MSDVRLSNPDSEEEGGQEHDGGKSCKDRPVRGHVRELQAGS
ncbi:MAG TPA: hypothetical protein VMC42_05970 [Methanoregulaceae archaeon]|nr:hypothetical protein [Methanoregulaceae archaeon]